MQSLQILTSHTIMVWAAIVSSCIFLVRLESHPRLALPLGTSVESNVKVTSLSEMEADA